MRILNCLIACERNGKVRDALIALGHHAVSCDLQPTTRPGPHYLGDVRDILYKRRFDLLVGFPPCTHLAVSGTRHFWRKAKEQEEALDFVRLLLNAPIDHIALENPKSIISGSIRQPDQIIQPWWFGDPVPKETHLWLKNLPLLKPTNIVEPVYFEYNSKRTKSGKSKYGILGKLGKGKGDERSITFDGIANAMANQYVQYILSPHLAIQKELFRWD